jgi:NlpC/P60 family putative phage cell wall peptidase
MTTRTQVVAEARSWLLTPYKQRAQLKGIGCDCATLLYCVMRDTGLIEPEDLPLFSSDWWAHTTEEKYLQQMLRHAGKVAEAVCSPSLNPEPGNIILGKTAGAHVYNHGAIITSWPMGVHAVKPHVMEVDLTKDPMWIMKAVAIFDPFQTKRG